MNSKDHCHLILIRHGETSWNVEGRYQGWTDIDLNENGIRQAAQLAAFYQERSIDAIYSSTLLRAVRTAEIIRGNRDLQLQQEADLREGYYGALEGMKLIEVGQKFQRELNAASLLPSIERMHFRLVPDQETGDQVARRASIALKRIAASYLGQTVIVVTHGGVIRSLLVSLADYEYSTTYIHNGQAVSFEGNAHELRIRTLDGAEVSKKQVLH